MEDHECHFAKLNLFKMQQGNSELAIFYLSHVSARNVDENADKKEDVKV